MPRHAPVRVLRFASVLAGALASACGSGAVGQLDAARDGAIDARDGAIDARDGAIDAHDDDARWTEEDAIGADGAIAPEHDGSVAIGDAGTEIAPIVAPDETWTWVEIPGMRCANGTPTGIGLNLTSRSDRVLIFLQGGGACWDGRTCWGPVATSFYVRTGYNRSEFETDVLRPALLPMRRSDPNNPFRDMNLVYVPYCTGDVHAGDHVVTYEYLGAEHVTYHVGARNLDLLLPRLAATFPRSTRVWVSGDSAGGFGSAVNFGRVQSAFPNARVDVLDDSGQPIEPAPDRWAAWRDAWNLQVPADCPDCRVNIRAFVDYYRARYPQSRFGLISFTNDSVITPFMGLRPDQFYTQLMALGDHMDRTWPNGHYYFLLGTSHVGLASPTPGLIRWIEQMVSDDPTWQSRRPFQ